MRNLQKKKMLEEYNAKYMLGQIERLQWENHHLRMFLTLTGVDMDKINEMIGLGAWIKEKTRREGRIND